MAVDGPQVQGMRRPSTRSRRATSASTASVRSRSPTTTPALDADVGQAADPGRAAEHLALRRLPAVRRQPAAATLARRAAALTPLVRADRLAERLGLGEVWVKNDAANPTHSFKDRVVASRSRRRPELGFEIVACASTGNLANAVAAHAAAPGLDSYVFVPADLEEQKILATGVYGTEPRRRRAATTTTSTGSAPSSSGERDWAFVNVNLRPYYAEGSKTLAYEIAEQLGWQAARPGRRADRLRLALHEDRPGLRRVARPRPGRGRAAGRSTARRPPAARPVAQRLRGRARTSAGRSSPDTIAKSLAIGNPADGPYALELARAHRRRRSSRSPTTRSATASGCWPRRPAIFTETAGGVTTATLAKLAERGRDRRRRARRASTSPARA